MWYIYIYIILYIYIYYIIYILLYNIYIYVCAFEAWWDDHSTWAVKTWSGYGGYGGYALKYWHRFISKYQTTFVACRCFPIMQEDRQHQSDLWCFWHCALRNRCLRFQSQTGRIPDVFYIVFSRVPSSWIPRYMQKQLDRVLRPYAGLCALLSKLWGLRSLLIVICYPMKIWGFHGFLKWGYSQIIPKNTF